MEQIIKADYTQAVKAIKQAIVVCRYRAARQMNGEVLGLYYSIGKYISEQALRDISKPMGVATYHSVEELPSTYQALPSVEELKKLL